MLSPSKEFVNVMMSRKYSRRGRGVGESVECRNRLSFGLAYRILPTRIVVSLNQIVLIVSARHSKLSCGRPMLRSKRNSRTRAERPTTNCYLPSSSGEQVDCE